MKILLIVIFNGLFFIRVVGCDFFKTRDPESPTQTASSFKPPDTPEIVLENFKSAIQEHNVKNYMRCFIDTLAIKKNFIFNPSRIEQGIFDHWGLEDEERYFQNLGEPLLAVPYLNFSTLQQANVTSTSTEFTMHYILFYPHQRSDISKEVKGYMHLYLILDNQHRWSIYQWDDSRTISDSTWSYLKAHF